MLEELYVKIKGREEDKEEVSDAEVLKFCALELSKEGSLQWNGSAQSAACGSQ